MGQDRNDIAASADHREPPVASGPIRPERVIKTCFYSTLSALAVVLLASCSGAPRQQAGPGGAAAGEPDRQDIVRFAKTFVGTPYRSGGTSYQGVDCSGLAYVVYRQFDIRLPRTSVDQSRVGFHVDRSNLEPADLLFFKTTRRGSISHVGIYIGKGKFVHASTGARTVRVDALNDDYYKNRYVGARRVLRS